MNREKNNAKIAKLPQEIANICKEIDMYPYQTQVLKLVHLFGNFERISQPLQFLSLLLQLFSNNIIP